MENTKEWIEIIDTAVKIGLGTLISGAFTYLGIKLSHRHNKEKFLIEHKLQMIESIISDTEKYFTAYDRLLSGISGLNRTKENKTTNTEIKYTQDELKQLRQRDDQLKETWKNKISTKNKLTLLQANGALNALERYESGEIELRDRIWFKKEKKYPNNIELNIMYANKMQNEKIFQKELSKLYNDVK